MSSSGPSLPTKNEENLGGHSVNPTEDHLKENAKLPSPLSNSPNDYPIKESCEPSAKGEEKKISNDAVGYCEERVSAIDLSHESKKPSNHERADISIKSSSHDASSRLSVTTHDKRNLESSSIDKSETSSDSSKKSEQTNKIVDCHEEKVLRTKISEENHGARDLQSSITSLATNYPYNLYSDGGGDGLAFVESDEETSPEFENGTPPAARWSISLRELLNDKEGCELFELFLNEDRSKQSIKMLKFWYACSGLRKGTTISADDTKELINLIWNKFIVNDLVKVSTTTKSTIREKIKKKIFDSSIFDEAQFEVEMLMNETVYPKFLRSNLYLSFYLGNKDNIDICPEANSLPTLHEDSEFDQSQFKNSSKLKGFHKLTSNNLLASVRYRANADKIKAEEFAGVYLREEPYYRKNPYHGGYVSGHTVSLQDSERQSLSSGARTDDALSCTDSSIDGVPLSSNYLRKKHHRLLRYREEESLLHNKNEETFELPKTMKYHQPSIPIATTNPEQFFKLISDKLEKVIEDNKKNEKIQCTMRKLIHSEDDPNEVRREHAVNSLPPNVLVNKLQEKVLDEMDQCLSDQSILDNHIQKWDPSTCSPGSPKYGSQQVKGSSSKQGLVHMSLPLLRSGGHTHTTPTFMAKAGVGTFLPTPASAKLPQTPTPRLRLHSPAYNPLSHLQNFTSLGNLNMCGSKGSKHHSYTRGPFRSTGYSSTPHSLVTTPMNSKSCFMEHQKNNGIQFRRNFHHRERGQDVYSTFSSDSGNVADYHEHSERNLNVYLSKSKSIPAYMENHTVSEGGSASESRRQVSGSRKSGSEKPIADFTDSGVSVVSDSGRSVTGSSSERVETWLMQSRPFTSPCNSCSEMDFNNESKKRGPRSSVHTVAGFYPSTTQRIGEGSSGCHSQCSSSTSAVTCITSNPINRDNNSNQSAVEFLRDSPLGQSQQHIAYERRKHRQISCHGNSSESSLKKQQRLPKYDPTQLSQEIAQSPTSGLGLQATTIIYNFSDDDVPFMVKLQTRQVTLKRFKENLPKKGSFRFYFKKVCSDVGVVFEEITEDTDYLPLFEGKVFSLIRKDESKEES